MGGSQIGIVLNTGVSEMVFAYLVSKIALAVRFLRKICKIFDLD